MRDPVTDYAHEVIVGKRVACLWVRLACERHMRDLKNPRFVWDLREVNKRIEMCGTMYHYQGPAKGTPFNVEPWEAFVVGSTFGWKWKDSGLRRYKYSFVKVPKKNGKTWLAVTVGCQMLIAGGQLTPSGRFEAEGGAEVYFVATKEEQAKKGWGDLVKAIRRSPGYSSRLTCRVKEIRHEESDGICKPLGSDSDTLDGLNPSCVVKDELHAWKDRRLWDIMEDGFGARAQPLDFIITTEGVIRGGISDEMDTHAKNILKSDGSYQQENFFAIIYTIDEGDDPFSEASWFKANPCLGVFGAKDMNYMRDQAATARLMPSKFSTFMTKQLNVRMDVEETWLSLDQWDACKSVVNLDALKGVDSFSAIDLGRVGDWSSFCQVFPSADETFEYDWTYWIPEETYDALKREGRLPVDVWKREGSLFVTSGNVTDFATIEAFITARSATHPMREMCYDPMFAHELAMRLRDEHGLNVVEFRQTFTNYTPACSQFERMLLAGQLRHNGHPVARWNAGNVVLRKGPSGNMMPDKQKSAAKIDGISAALMATGRAIMAPPPPPPPAVFFV